MEILTRAGLSLLIIFAGIGFYLLYQRRTQLRTPGLLSDLGPRRPQASTLVYFTTPTCVPCKTVQRPAIEQLSKTLGDALNVFEIDATERPEMASRWGVLSVPTTFVIDPNGAVLHINHGVARTEKLLKQLYSR